MGRPISVLLVEDVEDDAELVIRELRRGGFAPEHRRVDTAEEMREALRSRSWDLVISDFSMPQFSMPEALALLRAHGSDAPFIIVSGTVGEDKAVAAMKAGAHDYLIKGNLARLIPAVERELREAKVRAERQRATEALRMSDARFRALIEWLPGYVVVTRPSGEILYANPALGNALGFDSADLLVGRDVVEAIVHPDEWAGARGRIAQAARTGYGASKAIEVRWLRQDGSVLFVSVASRRLTFGDEPAVVTVAHDVSERRQMITQMMQVDRMAAMGTLAAGVAHEINNPLAYVLANLEFARKAARESDPERPLPHALAAELAEVLDEAYTGADRVKHIVRDLKVFSRVEADKVTPVDVHTVLESTLNMAVAQTKHRCRVVREFSEVPVVWASESRLGQVFLNLILNAAQAIPEGAAEDHELRIRTAARGDRVCVEVEDTGVGIPAEHLERLFDAFFTTKKIGEGTGLGLAICQRIIRELGGEIRVESTVGKGTRFTVLLPLGSEPHPEAEAKAPQAPVSERRLRLLYIDDEAMLGHAVRRALADTHEVTVVERALEARERLLGSERFDVVLCDMLMPELTGMDLYELLERERPEVTSRMVFLTGGAFTPRAREFLDRVQRPILYKPFEFEQLRAVIAGITGERGPERR